MAEPLSSLPASLGVVRLLQSFGGKSLPIRFVAERLGLSEVAARERVGDLAAQNLVSLEDDKVTLNTP